ncbi:MAG: tandem-95 repeat protein [Verrucomicrobiales bacterium]|nr:tandem-95 repeat protein [Verrucomicrobiales bacterium]
MTPPTGFLSVLRASLLLPLLLPLTTLGAPVAVNDSYTTNEDAAFSPGGAGQNLISGTFDAGGMDVTAGTWQYLDKLGNHLATPPGTGAYPVDGEGFSWKDLGFDVPTSTVGPWGTGTMGAGGGIQGGTVDGISTTPVLTGMTGGPGGQYLVTTYLFRKVFTLTAAQAAIADWDCSVLMDDGAIIYINGQQVGQVGMGAGETYNPDGSSTPITANTATTLNSNESTPTLLTLNLAGKLNAGNNVIAVEVHQLNNSASSTGFSSSDVGLNLTLIPTQTANATDGFTAVKDCFFGTNRPDNETLTLDPTGGFNGTGALKARMGNVPGGGNTESAVSAGWRRQFTLAAPATVTVSFRHRMLCLEDYDTNEYCEVICDVNGSQYGTTTAPSTHNAVAFRIGDGNGGSTMDTGWEQSSFDIALPAGTHTLTLGGYANRGTQGFSGKERFDVWLDDVSISVPSTGDGVLANDTGTAPVTAVKDTDPAHGSLTFNADGTFTYTPQSNYNGSDAFTYHAHDSTGDSAPATVNITITAVNDAPVAVNDGPYAGTEDTTLNVTAAQGLLANDSDVENSPLTASLVTQSTSGTATVQADGSFSFAPAANFSGTTTFTYRVSDGTLFSNDATVTINLANTPDDPVAVNDTYVALKNTPLVVTAVTASTTTEDAIPLKAADWHYYNSLVLANRNLGTAWRGTSYAENADWKVGPAELGYGDGDEATVIEDNGTAGFNSGDADKFATYYFRRQFEIANKALISAVELRIIHDDAAVVFINGTEVTRTSNLPSSATMPDLAWDYFQSGSFSENLVETWPLSVSAIEDGTNLVAAEVHQTNASSSDVSFDLRLRLTRVVQGGVLSNDSDPDAGSSITVDSFGQPGHGSVTVNADGTFTYTPANGYVGADSFTYVVKDETGRTASGTASITITTGPNVAPVANADTYAATEDQVLNVAAGSGVLVNDTDAEGDPFTAMLVTPPQKGGVVLNADGSFTYTPNANANGADSFAYSAFDGKNSPPATVTINIAPVNDPPVAVNDTYFANPSETINLAAPGLLGNDTDIDTAPANLSAVLNSPVTGGTLNLNASGAFSYTAPAAAGTYTFTYRTNDGSATSAAPATVTLVVNGTPTAVSESYDLVEDNVLSISAAGVLANDSDPENQPLSAVLVAPPLSGDLTLNANGSFTFTPALNFAGVISFTYKASDGVRESAPATVTITVSNVQDPPVAAGNTYSTTIDTPLIIAPPGILANDSDPDTGTTLTLALLSDVTHGTLVLGSAGGFTYTPATGYLGEDSFTYRVSDGQLNSTPATVSISVVPPVRKVKINEIMFRPAPSFPEPVAEEWIELRNTEGFPADISGWQLTSGVSFTFAPGTVIPSQGYLVVCANLAAFQAKNPSISNVVGPWTGRLSNNGEKIALSDTTGTEVDYTEYCTQGDWGVRYRETTFNGYDWQSLADGGGHTLELRQAALSSLNGQNWGDSSAVGGTPGVPNSLLSTNVAPLISKVKHAPAVPKSTDSVTISCELEDETPPGLLTCLLFWRDATATSGLGSFQAVPMTGDGSGDFFATLPPKANLAIVEFYLSVSDGANTRTWPPPVGNEGQVANCQYQVANEVMNSQDAYYRMVLTGPENSAFNGVSQGSDRNFNQTLVVSRGAQHDIRYRSSMRIRGNSSRSYQFKPLRLSIPADNPLDDQTKINMHPKASHLQYLGNRTLQTAGLAASDCSPAELRRNGVESTTSSGGTPDFGKWVRLEPEGGEFVNNHFPLASGASIYKKLDGGLRTNYYWRSAGYTMPTDPDGNIDGWTKLNNSAENDWGDLTNFFTVWQAAATAHFPGAPATDVSQSNGSRLSGVGAWNSTAFSAAEYAAVSEVSDLDYWARWFAVMTILQDIETNLSNGVDDDYGAVFITGADGKRRMLPVAHDLDTIFGLGDSSTPFNSRGLYDMCQSGETFRTLLPLFGTSSAPGYAPFRDLYHQYIRQYYGSVLNADTTGNPYPPYHAFIDAHLTGWAPANIISSIKSFATQRQAYLLGLIGSASLPPAAATANPTVDAAHGTLMIHEILAKNVAAVNVSGAFPDIIELHNSAASSVTLTGLSITDDVAAPARHVFPPGTTIPAGGYLVLYADGGTGPNHLPFSLKETGETITLFNSAANGGGVLDSIAYGLQVADLSIGRTGSSLETWALCTPTSGAANAAVASLGAPGDIKINEWLGNPDYMVGSDFCELYNPAALPVAISGMSLTNDRRSFPTRYVFPAMSFLAPGSFTRFDGLGSEATPGNATEVSFKFQASYGLLELIGANGTLVDTVDLILQPPDASHGRSGDGAATVAAFAAPATLPTPGLSNATPDANTLGLINHLRITELHFNPDGGGDFEFVELQNTGATPLELAGVRFTQGIDFTFPNYTLAAGAYVVIIKDQAAFENRWGTGKPVAGIYAGSLSNGGEEIGLQLPVPQELYIHRFDYKDGWEDSADGAGHSLQIVSTSLYAGDWDEKESWQAGPPTPGGPTPFQVHAGLDVTVLGPETAVLDGSLFLGTYLASEVSVAWSKVSGPGTVTFTTTSAVDSNANFSLPGTYILRISATGPAGAASADETTVVVQETYTSWASRVLAAQPPANRQPEADPDRDGMANLIEFALGGNPLVNDAGTLVTLVQQDDHLTLHYQRNLGADPAILIIPQVSEDLAAWNEGPAYLDHTLLIAQPPVQTWQVRDINATYEIPRHYIRLKVELP